MALIIALDVLAVTFLCGLALTRKLEGTLPAAAFLLLLFPAQSQIALPGFFVLTTQRIIIVFLFILYMIPGIGPVGDQRRQAVPLKLLMVIQILWMLLSSANSAVPVISFKTVLSQMLDFFLPFYIFCKTITHVSTIHKILYAMVLATGLACVFGTIQIYAGWSVLSLFPVISQRFDNSIGVARGLRVASTFPHPILFGIALAIAIPIALYLLSTAKNTRRRAVLWAAILLMFLNIYKTGSRGPWLALILSIGLMGMLGSHRVRKYILVIIMLSVTVLVARPGVWDTIESYYYSTLNPDSAMGSSYEWRYALFSMAWRELGRSLPRAIWGYGPESFFYLGLTGEFQGRVVAFESCDNAVAKLLIETGYVGFLITALLLLTPALFALRTWRRLAKDDRKLCAVFLSGMAAYFFMMMNVSCYGWGQQDYFLWLTIAFTMVYPHLIAPHAVKRRGELQWPAAFPETVSWHEMSE